MPVNQESATEVDGWFSRLGRVLLPPRCLVCGEPGSGGRDLCEACQRALPWNRCACMHCGLPLFAPEASPGATEGGTAPEPLVCGRCLRRPPPLERVHAAFRYGFPVDRLLPRFKFHRDLAAGRELAHALRRSLEEAAGRERPDALVPVPLHPARLRERGYNQALELARPLARAFAIPLAPEALERVRDTAPQSGLGALARRRNPRGAFEAGAAPPAHVVLVDDVMTTGATLSECAKVLRRAGARRVDAWVVARVPSR